ncbi:hypothetical protein D3C72_1277250 [compost metagenome]
MQLDDGFARDDDFLAREFLLGCNLTERQTVTVGCHGNDVLAVDDQQQAVQVVTNVLLRHREVHHVEQVLQGLLRQRDFGVVLLGLRNGREFFSRQGLQCETGFARLHGHALVSKCQRHVAGVRQRAQDVEQFTRSNRGRCNVVAATDLCVRGDLHFNVGRQERDSLAILANEDIGQNRQCVPTLDNTTHNLQRT